MKPLFAIITNIYVRIGNILKSFARISRVRKNVSALVVPSHKLGAFICLALMVSVPPAFGTAGVVFVIGNSIIIAADSALKRTNSKGETTGMIQGCKILRKGNIYFFGVGEYAYPPLGFNLYRIAEDAITKTGKVRNIYPSFEASIGEYLPAIVKFNKEASTVEYTKWLRGVPIIVAVFASFEGNAPVVNLVEFKIDAIGRIIPPNEKTFVDGDMSLLGISPEVAAATNTDTWNRRIISDPVNASAEIIQLEIDVSTRDKRYDVGPPISIVRISGDSSGMVPGYEGVCQTSR
jgi:hypothetical protein